MKHLYSAIPVIFALLLYCSTDERIAGSKGGSETTNGVTACICHKDGSPAGGCIVRLRPADYVSRSVLLKTKINNIDLKTDPQGRFLITNIDPGAYCIEVNDPETEPGKSGAILFTFTADTGTIDLGTDSLSPYATLTGRIDMKGIEGRPLHVQVKGLERLVSVDNEGLFVFNDLPQGFFDVRVVGDESDNAVREIVNIKTSADDTVDVKVTGGSTFTGYIYFNSASEGFSPLGTITDFPLIIRLDSTTFDFSSAHPEGNDIRFSKTDGTPLSFEIEQWDPIAQKAAIWVRVDTLNNNDNDNCIVMKWGESNTTNKSNGTTVFDTAQGFGGVWHLNENPYSGANTVKDRTSNGYNGTAVGSMTSSSVVPGIIGDGLKFDGNDDHIDAGILNLKNKYTLSCWINADDLDSTRRFVWKEYSYTLWYDGIGQGIRIEHFTDSLVWRGIYQDNSHLIPLNSHTWYYLAGTFDGNKIRLYINGELVDSTQTIGVNPHSSQEPLSIGGRNGEFFKGIMDEVRIENVARSAEWIRLCFLNQKPNSVVTKFIR